MAPCEPVNRCRRRPQASHPGSSGIHQVLAAQRLCFGTISPRRRASRRSWRPTCAPSPASTCCRPMVEPTSRKGQRPCLTSSTLAWERPSLGSSNTRPRHSPLHRVGAIKPSPGTISRLVEGDAVSRRNCAASGSARSPPWRTADGSSSPRAPRRRAGRRSAPPVPPPGQAACDQPVRDRGAHDTGADVRRRSRPVPATPRTRGPPRPRPRPPARAPEDHRGAGGPHSARISPISA